MLGICAVLILASALAALFIAFKGARLRRAIYRYDVRRDQKYEFPASRTSRVVGQLYKGSLLVQSPLPSHTVVLLELKIGSTLLGYWFEPYIEIQGAGSHGALRQPFERGGSGMRFVEISQFTRERETSIRIKGRFLTIRDQPVVLHCVKQNIDLDRQRILVLGTHPDDAEIAAFGVYCDRDAFVVTLTAGEAGESGPFERFGRDARREKGRNRAWNSVTVPMLGGLPIERAANLGYFDGMLTVMKERPDVPTLSQSGAETLADFGQSPGAGLVEPRGGRRATWKNLVSDFEHLLTSINPGVVVAPYPRLDAHPDHKLSTVALLEALKNLNWRHGSLLLYTNHLCSSDRYPFGEAGDLVSLPPGVENIYFDGIVSLRLDTKRQALKHMALDAMIDLRPQVGIDSVGSVARAFKQALKWAITDGHDSYFRKAVRSNELFFEVLVASLYEPGVTERIIGGLPK